MRAKLPLAVLVFATLLSGCGEEPPVLPDVTWEPALDEDNSATIDLGTIEQGESAQAMVIGTNNSIEAITFQLNCSFNNGGFLVPGCPMEQTVEPSETTVPVSATLSTNLSGTYSGTFQFIYDDEIATFVVQGIVQ